MTSLHSEVESNAEDGEDGGLDASNNKVAHEEPTGETDDVTLCDK